MVLHKLKLLVFFLTVTAFFYIFFVHNGLVGIDNFVGDNYTPTETEVNFMSTMEVFSGNGLYRTFGIVYPPGRYIIQAIFFRLLDPTVTTARLYFAIAEVMIAPMIFFLSWALFRKKKFPVKIILSFIASFIYLFFVNSAQEVHLLVALFFIILLNQSFSVQLRSYLLGVLLSTVFLFRIETGILLSLSLVAPDLKLTLFRSRPFILGGLTILVPLISHLLLFGSLPNFLHDTLYIGLRVQPLLMASSIPSSHYFIFFASLVFLLFVGLSGFISSKNSYDRSFFLLVILSFASSLGRSDEGHLWYGLVFMPVLLTYSLSRFYSIKQTLSLQNLPLLASYTAFSIGLTGLILQIKSVPLFIGLTLTASLLLKNMKRKYAVYFLTSGAAASLLLFHSLSYIKLRLKAYSLPNLNQTFKKDLFYQNEGEFAGLLFSNNYLGQLNEIKSRLEQSNDWLFIFPNHDLFYTYFERRNPSRYYYHTGETTDKIQVEMIKGFQKNKVVDFIFFPEEATFEKKVRTWIMENTQVIYKTSLGGRPVELRKKTYED